MTSPSAAEVARLSAVIANQRRELDLLRAQIPARAVVDLARGMLMEQFGCSPAEAQGQLTRLAAESGLSVTDLAAQITNQPVPDAEPDAAPDATDRPSLAGAAIEAAPDGTAVATAMLEEVLRSAGATAVALWLTEPDGGLQLAGQAGFAEHEASRWRRIPPQMRIPQIQAAQGTEIWWPAGPPAGEQPPLMGDWPGGALAAVPLQDARVTLGVLLICWPEPLGQFPDPLRQQIVALADLSAQAVAARLPDGGLAADHRASWVLGLLDGLLGSVVFAQAVRDGDGRVTDFHINHVSAGFADPAGRRAAELTGRRLLEMYPAAAASGGLFDACVQALASGAPQHAVGEGMTGHTRDDGAVPEVRVAPLYDGVAIAWRQWDERERFAALLQHAQRLGRIGGWEENLRTGDVHWTEPTFVLFGRRADEAPVRLDDLHTHVPAEDYPSVEVFRATLLHDKHVSAAAFRIIRDDDGSVRQMRAYAEPLTDGAGAVVAVRGAYQDVSADYHTRLAFAAAREQLADTEERAQEEHRLAMRLQEAITPRSAKPVNVAGLDVAARYRPSGAASLVSGDWYDTVPLPTGEVLLVVGDIAGHGIEAVTGMVAARNSLRGLAITGGSPAALLGWLNDAACHLTDGLIGTAICGLYTPQRRSLRWARAGHLPPILVHEGTARQLPVPHGLLLGADPGTRYEEVTTPLQPGDTLLLFTDGLVERRDTAIDDAISTLIELASRPVPDVEAFADLLLTSTASDTGDDACLVAVHVR